MISWTASYAAHFLRTHLLFIGVLLLILLYLLLGKYPQQQVAAVRDRKDRIDLEAKSRQTLAQIVGGAVLLVGLYFTAQTLRITQEGQITERFTKAIDQLGKDNLPVRLGGIYALQRIARDSESDYWAVMEVLTAFVREQTQGRLATSQSLFALLFPKDQKGAEPPTDIQAILTVLGSNPRTYGKRERQRLNLVGSQLPGANLEKAHLEGFHLWAANLKGAVLSEAHLEGAILWRAHLERAHLQAANLKGAVLWETYLEEADLSEAHLEEANFVGAYLQRTRLMKVNLMKVKNLTQDQVNIACIDEKTVLPQDLTRPPPCS